MIYVPRRRVWTQQPFGSPRIAVGRSAPIAVVVPGQNSYAKNLSNAGLYEPNAAPTGTGVHTIIGPLGASVGSVGSSSLDTIRLHSVANQTNTVWERPTSAVSVLVYLIRRGNAGGNSPIFANSSPSTAPYTAWGLVDSGGIGNLQFQSAPGGTYTALTDSGVVANNVPICVIGIYDGSTCSLFVNNTLRASAAGSGALAYPNAVNRGPAVGNFYNYTGAARSFVGEIYLCALWDRALIAAERAAYSNNPNLVIAAANNDLYLPGALFPTLSSPRMTGITATGGVPTVNYTF